MARLSNGSQWGVCPQARPRSLRRSWRRWAGPPLCPPIRYCDGRGLAQSPPMSGGGGVARVGSGGAALGAGRGRRSPRRRSRPVPAPSWPPPPASASRCCWRPPSSWSGGSEVLPAPPLVPPVRPAGPRGDPRPPLCLCRSRARLRLAMARREGRGGPAAPRQGPEERRQRQVTAAPGGAGGTEPDRRGPAVVGLRVPPGPARPRELPAPCGRAL